MHRKLFLLGMIVFVLSCLPLVVSVNASSMWSKTYGGMAGDAASSLVATPDGGYAIAGIWNFTPPSSFESQDYNGDFWLVKTDAFGVVPEYSSWLIPALVLTATAFVIINKKRLLHKRS